MRARSLIATLTMVGGLVVYAFAVTRVAELLPPSVLAQTAFFAIAGIVWIGPAACLVRWSARSKSQPPATGGRLSASSSSSAGSGTLRSDNSP